MLRAQKLSSALAKHVRTFATVTQPLQVGVVRPSDQEVKNRTLDSRNLEKAVRNMHGDGLVVVEDVVPHEDIDILNKKMIEDAHTLQARGDKGPFNYNKGNIQQDAPPVSEYFSPSIFTSEPIFMNLLNTN
ncbi:phytanoyl- dioxygenase [Fusarium acutatum]|uniref:Phytanoyl- dioxygenase n=1 Tax=Fusarium acutatum TaxID=78861 RepID=A0A8H4JN99_9HYPO|nr:phytanoyl- dioxygenase [Fusarium acutatum]